ncbi:hypothetical protein TIFTF001_029891 [Ficus carica]|uniref:Uncharacterized protein n=1 Tax=Ficus carica TaxID=3494 RepID=A0AA88DT60_FICCA|nr:hypothetical protein TIFTF001_029891 [Ficus carica]
MGLGAWNRAGACLGGAAAQASWPSLKDLQAARLRAMCGTPAWPSRPGGPARPRRLGLASLSAERPCCLP